VLVTISFIVAVMALAAWLYLAAARGGFWLTSIREEHGVPAHPATWPRVVAVIPARNETDVISHAVASLLSQNYLGPFGVVVVDDQSEDDTAAAARAASEAGQSKHSLTVVHGTSLPPGWVGKVWALEQGIAHAQTSAPRPDYLLLSDADICYEAGVVRDLVARAEAGRLMLTSLMVKLRCESAAERGLVPAFVFFFQMLYPFAWVNRPDCATAAAAGGCMLVRTDGLRAIGGIAAIRSALIDDCALGRKLKSVGPIWLGLTGRVRSLRAYPRFGDIRRMVARSAYDQLGYSPLLLCGTIAAMALVYLVGPLLALLGTGAAQLIGLVTWLVMAALFVPIARFYGVSPLWGLALPGIALAYMGFTVDSAYQYLRGRGGRWKGRVQAGASELG
jgi:hopene-associated glycosyltransferase HpnB